MPTTAWCALLPCSRTVATLVDLANWAKVFYVDSVERNAEDTSKHGRGGYPGA
jgi:hypothetical protein